MEILFHIIYFIKEVSLVLRSRNCATVTLRHLHYKSQVVQRRREKTSKVEVLVTIANG